MQGTVLSEKSISGCVFLVWKYFFLYFKMLLDNRCIFFQSSYKMMCDVYKVYYISLIKYEQSLLSFFKLISYTKKYVL